MKRSTKPSLAMIVVGALSFGSGGCKPRGPSQSPAHAHGHARAPGAPGSRASEAFRREHAHVLARLEQTEAIAAALPTTPADQLDQRIHDVVHFFRHELLPHAEAEEEILYSVADRYVPTKAPYRWTDSLRYEHTVVHAAIEDMTAFMQGKDRSPEAVAKFSRTVIRTLGLIRGHFGAEENVVLDALDRSMTAEDFQREVIEPTERYVAEHAGRTEHHH